MITIEHELDKPFSQDFYNKAIDSIQLHQLKCPCGRCSSLTRHGSYHRTVKAVGRQFRLRVCRLRCPECGHTHALMLSCMIPYSQILVNDTASIIICYETHTGFSAFLQEHLSIDENNIGSVIRRYKNHWQQRLWAESLPLTPLPGLIRLCFQAFSRQFMQIKTIPNILFFRPT